MKKPLKIIKDFTTRYIDWVIRLGEVKFSLLGVAILAIFALLTQSILSLIFIDKIHLPDIVRSIIFGLSSAPFVVYFFTLLVERLERSRLRLAASVDYLRHEISDRINTEKRLSEALSNLAQNHREKSALMATISHELRTPLNGIIGLSNILLDDNLTEKQRNYLQTINTSAITLSYIFNDIIDLEKINANRIELCKKETEFPRFINDISNFATLMAQQHNLKFVLDCPKNLPQWLLLDSHRLSQVLWNLINNAVKFTPNGTITLHVEQRSHTEFAFILEDTGIGIPKKDLPRIFDMYYQVKSTGHKQTGSGIGLAISKTIAKLMGGNLTVESELNKGSIFTITFQAEITQKSLDIIKKLPTTLHILLVEDIEINIIVAKAMLEKLGYFVDVAMTGKEAIYKFEHNDYDLLLLDIQLPDISGIEIAQYLRHQYENDNYNYLPPIIALTANVMQSKTDYQKYGIDDVLRKPLEFEALTTCIRHFFADEISTITQDKLLDLTPTLENSTFEQSLTNTVEENSDTLNTQMLKELLEMLGNEFVESNLRLFEKTMPEYLKELDDSYQNYQKNPALSQSIASIAHKIKGSAASVGLLSIQRIMLKIQQNEREEWKHNVDLWVNEIHSIWQKNITELKNWLKQQSS